MNKFTKQHYEIVAKVLAECTKQTCIDDSPAYILDWIAEEFRAIFAKDNPSFDVSKFLATCER